MENTKPVVIRPKKNMEQTAIEVIEAVCKEKGLGFTIYYKGPSKSGNTTMFSNQWKIQVMGQTFRNEDFIKCVGEAMKFIHKAIY